MAEKMDFKKLLMLLYGIYAGSMIMQFFEQTMIPGFLAMVIAVIIVYNKKENTAGGIFETHIRWLIRTFWIGTGLFFPFSLVVATILILLFTDMDIITNAAVSGDPDTIMASYDAYFRASMDKIMLFSIISFIPTAGWWLWRCWTGYALLKEDQAVDNVTRWF
jgi:uncharacterized membrane protein